VADGELFSSFVDSVLPAALWLLGVGFLVANLRLLGRFLWFRRQRPTAVLTWPGRPSAYGVSLGFGVLLGALLFMKVVVWNRPLADAFGEGMMFIYYAYAFPLSLRIGHGFYDTGVWSDEGLVPYGRIGGLSWKGGADLTLVLIDRVRNLVRHLEVPQEHYGEVRRLLRDKIAAHDIQFAGKGFDLGSDEREVV
jgi:hypothetical protein